MGWHYDRHGLPKGIVMDDRHKVSVLNALTGEITERDMTPEEIAALPAEPLTPTE